MNTFGGTVKYAGLALTSLTIAAILVRPIAGVFLDRYGRKLILVLGILVFVLPIALYIKMLPILLLVILRFVQGIGWGAGHTATGAVALDIIPGERMGEGLGIYSLVNSISMAFAPALSLWLIDAFSFEKMFLVCLIVGLAALALSAVVKCPQIKPQKKNSGFAVEKTSLWPSMVIFFIIFTHSALVSFLPIFAIEQGLQTAGIFFTILALSALVSRFVSGIILDRSTDRGYDINMIVGTATVVIALIILARTTETVHLVIGGIFYGFGFGFLQLTLHLLAVINASNDKKGMANATYWTAVDLGVSAGSFFWGFIAAGLGFYLMFNLTVVPVVISYVFYQIWRGKIIGLQPDAADK